MRNRIALLLLASLALWTSAAHALDPAKSLNQYRLTQWGVDDGLAHGSVHMLAEDREGFLWAGTLMGLARFDGVNFAPAMPMPGKRADYFARSMAFGENESWVAMGEGGIGLRIDHRWDVFALPEVGHVRAVALRRGGGYWVGGEKGAFRMNSANGMPVVEGEALPVKGPVWFIREDSDGRLWVGSDSGTRMREPDGRWRHLEAEFGLPLRVTWTVFRDSRGIDWIGGRNGLLRFDGKSLKAFTPADGLALATVRGIAEDKTGALWIATPGGGLQRFREGQRDGAFETLTTRDGLNSDSIFTVLVDRAGNIWAGMAGGGVARLSDPPIRTFRKKDGLTGDWIWTVHQDEAGDLWVGTNGNGLSVMREGKVVRRIPGNAQGLDSVWAMHPWDRGRAIISTTAGIARVERDDRLTWIYRLADGEPISRVFLRMKDGRLLLAKGRRLFEVRADALLQAQWPELPGAISSLLENADGSLTVGTRQGGIHVLARDGTAAQSIAEDLGGPVYALQRDSAGRIWASANGIFIMDKTRKVRIGPANGFPDRNSNDLVLTADGTAWIGTNRGILRAPQASLLACLDDAACKPVLQSLDERDGLITAETNGGAQPNGVLDKDGHIWWPAINGLIRIDSKEARANPKLPGVAIDGLRADRAWIPWGQDVPALTRDVEIDYTLPELTLPKQVRFRYRLTPAQSDWTQAEGRRTAFFSSLKPGTYTFEVQAARLHGEWPEKGTMREFTVAAAWYQTVWARLLSGVLLLAALVLAPWLRIRTLRTRKAMLESEVANRTSELAAVNRQLDVMARTDALTGIANRREFGERLAERCQTFDGHGVLAVMIADIDDFKAYNDHYGHPAGDVCLHAVAQALQGALPEAQAQVCRYGGEEFAVVARLPDEAAARLLAERLVNTVRSLALPHAHSRAAKVVTLSLGLSIAVEQGANPAALLQRADAALYRAKDAGRNRAVAADQ
jgi:diguanylate cyclase (GGDEF)-like protein